MSDWSPRCCKGAKSAAKRFLLVACLTATVAARPDLRIVDRITVGDVRSEQEHAYAGQDVTVGAVGGRAFRQAIAPKT